MIDWSKAPEWANIVAAGQMGEVYLSGNQQGESVRMQYVGAPNLPDGWSTKSHNWHNVEVVSVRPVEGMKFDGEKPMMHLIPAKAEMALARVLTFGAIKYAPENWRKVDNQEERYMAAAMRHINAHRQGELRDSESGELHLSHALTCMAFLVDVLESSNE